MDNLTFTILIDPAEQVRATQAVSGRQRFAGILRWGWLVLTVPVILLSLANDVPLSEFWPYAVLIAIIGSSAAFAPILLRRQVRRAIHATPSLREPQTYQFTPEGLRMSNALASSELRWDGVLEAAETREFVLLYYTPKCAYYVPKRIIGAQLPALRQFLRRHLGPRAASLPTTATSPQVA